MKNSERKIGSLLGTAIGDALCTPLEGLSPGHIRSTFGRPAGYIDPAPALKGKMDRWKKPALYTSITQMIILMLICSRKGRGMDTNELTRSLANNPPLEGNRFGALRHPGPAERGLLEEPLRKPEAVPLISCARTAVIAAVVAAVSGNGASTIFQGLNAALALNRDAHSVAGALVFGLVLEALMDSPGLPANSGLFELAVAAAENAGHAVDKDSGSIFEAGTNPESLLIAIKDFIVLFERLAQTPSREDAVAAICSAVNRHVKTPITRATVNHPLAVPSLALILCSEHRAAPFEALYSAAAAGGSNGSLGALCGAMAGASAGIEFIPPEPIKGLINRRKTLALIETLAHGTDPGDAGEFLADEAMLSRKEVEEYMARNRRSPIKPHKKKQKKEAERDISRHVVESWTKLDKARWRKEKQRSDSD